MRSSPDCPPLELICCPRCGGPLGGPPLRCAACALDFPLIGGLPWLYDDPGLALGEWRLRLQSLVAQLLSQAEKYRSALTSEAGGATTRSRLKLLSTACADHARRLKALLAPLGAAEQGATPELYQALAGGRVPLTQDLTAYYANVHRDWCWGEEESAAACRVVDAALGPGDCGRMLMLGVGAGRLAWDLYECRRPEVLLAADINPLMLLVAARILRGEALELYEFPLAPRDLESHAILRTLRAPRAAGPGLHLVFADAARSPFPGAAFDTVVTPWLVDILEEDFASFARRVNGWLVPGGRWVNSGSLAFQHPQPERCYSLEEVRELLEQTGFASVDLREDRLPYLQSPASRQGRVETVVSWGAVKVRATEAPAPAAALPDWLRDPGAPVPLTQAFSSRVLELRIHSFVGSLVDGRRSLAEMAELLVRERLMTAQEAEPALRACLARMHVDSRRAE